MDECIFGLIFPDDDLNMYILRACPLRSRTNTNKDGETISLLNRNYRSAKVSDFDDYNISYLEYYQDEKYKTPK